MGALDDIRPLTPTPAYTSIGPRRPLRKPLEKKPEKHPHRQPADEREDSTPSPPHIDEYA